MRSIEGKYSKADIFASLIDLRALEQIQELTDNPVTEGSRIAVMPDAHAGAGGIIGLVMTVQDKVKPEHIGPDIGCSISVVDLGKAGLDLNVVDKAVTRHFSQLYLPEIPAPIDDIRSSLTFSPPMSVYHTLGTLGGGNHFIEIDKDRNGNSYLVIHTGSRGLGGSVYRHYKKIADGEENYVSYRLDRERAALISRLKAEGREKEIQSSLKALGKDLTERNDESFLHGEMTESYLKDMEASEKFSRLNHQVIADIILSECFGGATTGSFPHFITMHNYIDTKRRILHKGSISLEDGEIAVIPISMRDGSLIVKGKGNPDYLFSGPHGAGRVMSRKKAKEEISIGEFRKSMEGIYSSTICEGTIDEAPSAYKTLDDILPHLGPTCEVQESLKSVYNFKTVETEPEWVRKKREKKLKAGREPI